MSLICNVYCEPQAEAKEGCDGQYVSLDGNVVVGCFQDASSLTWNIGSFCEGDAAIEEEISTLTEIQRPYPLSKVFLLCTL